MPHVVGVIQGRMGSTRLPGKLLAPIAGRPLLDVLVERVRTARVDEWWLATTDLADDDIAAKRGVALGIEVLRGDADDVLSRFDTIVERRQPTWVVRLTADDPFTDAKVIDMLLAAATPEIDHIGAGDARSLPLGYVPELVRASALREAAAHDLAVHHRAHVTSWVRETGRAAAFELPAGWPERSSWRWTVDTHDDLAMAEAAFRAFGGEWATIDYPAMVRVLDALPEIAVLNAQVPQKGVIEG